MPQSAESHFPDPSIDIVAGLPLMLVSMVIFTVYASGLTKVYTPSPFEGGLVHANANFSGAGPRIRLLRKGEDFRPSEFVGDDGKHGAQYNGWEALISGPLSAQVESLPWIGSPASKRHRPPSRSSPR